MNSTKLSIVFSLLSAYQINDLGKFLRSPYFNHRADVLHLYEYLRDEKAWQEQSREAVWNHLFPDVPFVSADFNRLVSRLYQLVESFLIHWLQPIDDLQASMELAKWYTARQQSELARKTLERISKSRAKAGLQSADLTLDHYRLRRALYNTSSHVKQRFGAGLSELNRDLDSFYFLEKLKLGCSQLAQRNLDAEEVELDLLPQVLTLVYKRSFEKEPLLGAYYWAFQMVALEDGAAAFQSLMALMEVHKKFFPLDEQRAIYLIAINYCIQQLNRGQASALQAVYKLYQMGLREEWLLENGLLSAWTYKNIVSAGIKLADFAWVSDFIEDNRERLPLDFRDNFYKYNLAELQLARGDFRDVLRTLRFLKFSEPLTHLRSRILQIKACMGLGDLPLAEYQLTSLKKLLQRRKSMAYHKENYLAFIRLTQRLLYWEPGDLESLNRLEGEIQAVSALVERNWLLLEVATRKAK